MSGHDATVTFVELSGPDAESRLRGLAGRLAPGSAGSELLRGVDDADRWLLIVRGEPPAAGALPSGARSWRFAAAGGTT